VIKIGATVIDVFVVVVVSYCVGKKRETIVVFAIRIQSY